MIAPKSLLIGKTIFKGAVVVAATEIVAYEINPAVFSQVAVGVGALAVAIVTIISVLLSNRSNRLNREQLAQIARDSAAALLLQAQSGEHLQRLEVRMDGRMDTLLASTAKIAETVGIEKGLQQAADAAHMALADQTLRDHAVVDKVSSAVIEKVSEAIDEAVQTVPKSKEKDTP